MYQPLVALIAEPQVRTLSEAINIGVPYNFERLVST